MQPNHIYWPRTNIEQRRRTDDEGEDGGVNTFKPAARFHATGGRDFTISIAVPGSIITE